MKKKEMTYREKIMSSLSMIFFVFLVVIISISISIRLNLVNSFFGYQPWLVKTQSMKPALQPGDLIISSVVKKDNIQLDDIVVFKTEDDTILTHRIISKKGNEYITKGDANNINDRGILTEDRIIGKQMVRIPFIGKLIVFTQSIAGAVFLIIGWLFIFFSKKLITLLKNQEE